jgi:ATP-dependent Clp protease ATP-binding subunit ClpA
MLERFTDDARLVVIAAKTKATDRGDAHVGGLHLLSALTTGDSVAARVLADRGVDSAAVDRVLGPGGRPEPEPDSADAEALRAIGIDLAEIKRKVEESFGEGALRRIPLASRGPLNWTGRIPFADDAKLALAESVKEARAFRHNHIGTEHLLLGLLRAASPPAPETGRPHGNLRGALDQLRLDYPSTRDAVTALLAHQRLCHILTKGLGGSYQKVRKTYLYREYPYEHAWS